MGKKDNPGKYAGRGKTPARPGKAGRGARPRPCPASSLRLTFLAGLLGIITSGCSGITVRNDDGTVYHFILGIGVIAVAEPEEQPLAYRTRVLGLDVATGPGPGIRAGYSSSAGVFLHNHTENLCAEISHPPFGGIGVNGCDSFIPSHYDNSGGHKDVE